MLICCCPFQLGKWKRASVEFFEEDDLLERFESIPFSEEIEETLRPHKRELEDILHGRVPNGHSIPILKHVAAVRQRYIKICKAAGKKSKNAANLPMSVQHELQSAEVEVLTVEERLAEFELSQLRLREEPLEDDDTDEEAETKTRVREPGNFIHGSLHMSEEARGVFLLAGNLTELDQARVANWLFTHLDEGLSRRTDWFGLPTMAHALTLLLAQRCSLSLDDAFRLQCVLKAAPRTDVDRECLLALEERMFEISDRAGLPYQWGLDAHQQKTKCVVAGPRLHVGMWMCVGYAKAPGHHAVAPGVP